MLVVPLVKPAFGNGQENNFGTANNMNRAHVKIGMAILRVAPLS